MKTFLQRLVNRTRRRIAVIRYYMPHRRRWYYRAAIEGHDSDLHKVGLIAAYESRKGRQLDEKTLAWARRAMRSRRLLRERAQREGVRL